MAEIEIITLPVEEWQRYRALRLESLRTDQRAFMSTYAAMLERPVDFWQSRLADAARGEKSWLLFAQAEGQLAGMIGAFCLEDPARAEIVSVYVLPAWRGRGIGGALMGAILDVLSRAGVGTALLGVNAWQETAVALYERFGFRTTEVIQVTLGDGMRYPEYKMEKGLDAKPRSPAL